MVGFLKIRRARIGPVLRGFVSASYLINHVGTSSELDQHRLPLVASPDLTSVEVIKVS